MLRKYLVIIFVVTTLMFQSVFGLLAEEKKDDVLKSKDGILYEVIEVVGYIPLLKTVQSISLIDKSDISSILAESLKEVVGLTPGLFTLSNGGFGQVSSTFIRGSKTTQTLYIVDGIRIRDFVNIGGINLSVVSPTNIDKIEIVRGPLSSIYGSDAQGGVISINTTTNKKLSFSGAFGSHNSYIGDISLFKSMGDLEFSLSLNSRRRSENIANDVFKNSGVSAKITYKRDNLNIGLRYFGNFTNSGVPFSWNLKPSPNTNYKQNYNILALPVNITLSDNSSLKMTGSFVKSDYSFFNPDASFNFYSKLISNSYTLESVFSSKINKFLSIKTGIEYSNFVATNETDSKFLIDNKKSNNFAAFLHGDINLDNLFMFLSVRLDKYKDIDSNFSPQVGFSYVINNMIKLRASYSNSFKAPLITQQVNPWGIPNNKLKPEKANSYEVGLDYYSKFASLGVTYFNTSYKDMINWVTVDMTTWAGQYQNIDEVEIKGYEVIASVTPTTQLSIRGSYTNLDTLDLKTKKPLLRRPKHTFSGLITYKNELFTTSLQLIYVGKRADSDPLSWPPLSESPAFNTFNFNVIVPVTETLSISGKVTNALNTEYSEIFGYRSPNRRFELGFRFKVH